ncbi:emp24/gp25L/p24 family protein [bacterium]|nr:emp24/gp25L/p24 family protein [bacterium]
MRKIFVCLFLFLMISLSLAADEPRKRVLMDKEVEVPWSESKEFHFLVPDGNWKFKGEFKTSGGMNDDINFLAMDQENYVRWYSHYNFSAVVKLERKKEEKFQFKAKSGQTYYFVFDNFFSTVSSKKIKLKIELVPLDKD